MRADKRVRFTLGDGLCHFMIEARGVLLHQASVGEQLFLASCSFLSPSAASPAAGVAKLGSRKEAKAGSSRWRSCARLASAAAERAPGATAKTRNPAISGLQHRHGIGPMPLAKSITRTSTWSAYLGRSVRAAAIAPAGPLHSRGLKIFARRSRSG